MEEKKVTKKKKSKTRVTIEWVLFSLFLVVFAFAGAAVIDSMVHKKDNYGQSLRFGVGTFIVLTDSMEPEYKQGSAIFTYKNDIESVVKDFRDGKTIDVTFYNENVGIDPTSIEFEHDRYKASEGGTCIVTNKVMTHRVMEIHEDTSVELGKGRYVFVTAGINDRGVYSLQGQYQLMTEKQFLGKVILYSPVLGSAFSFVTSPFGLIILLLIPAGYLIITSSIDIFKAMKMSEESEGNNTPSSLDNISDADKERLKKELLDEMINAKKKDKEDKE